MRKVQDVMSRRVATVGDTQSLADAAKRMWDENCGFVPVVESGTQKLCGVLTDRDVCMGAFTQGVPLHHVPVSVSMSRNVAVCGPNDDLRAVETIMRDWRVRRVPVVNERQHVVGVVSLDDIARASLESDDVAPRDSVARTLALLSQPEPVQALAKIFHASPHIDLKGQGKAEAQAEASGI